MSPPLPTNASPVAISPSAVPKPTDSPPSLGVTATILPSPVSDTLTPGPADTATTVPTVMPTDTPVPRPTVVIESIPVAVSSSSVTFDAYPFEKFLQPQHDPNNNFTFLALQRGAYEHAAVAGAVSTKTFSAVVLENEFLRLTFLPDLGGRLFQLTYKPAQRDLFYNNRVLKPTGWGPAKQGGWLAAGGMEWALPVNEHGYEWGNPWQYAVTQDSNGASITLWDSTATDRVRSRIQVTLPAHAAYFVVRPRVENPTGRAVGLQFWINTQLTLGAGKRVSPNTEFVLPADQVFVHSTGDSFIPAANVPKDNAQNGSPPLAWPGAAGRDMSRYSSWDDYLGVFAAHLTGSFVGAYNHDTDLGVARVFSPERAPGVKLFAFGPHFCCRSEFADDGSDYFELWGGLPRTFFPADDVTLAPGETREWSEYWIPFSGTGGVSAATSEAVLFLHAESGTVHVSAYSPVGRSATLVLTSAGHPSQTWNVTLTPGRAFSATTAANGGALELRLLAKDGTLLAQTQ